MREYALRVPSLFCVRALLFRHEVGKVEGYEGTGVLTEISRGTHRGLTVG